MNAWFCLVFLTSQVVLASSDYSWPLQQNYGVSATFGESRSDHYHAGIDLSTNGVTGLPVLAIADGSIHRLKVQKRGYGKALYIRHSDGTQSVYAHLESYSAELGLQQIYQKRSARLNTPYVGDIFVEPAIRIKRGEVIAYSGESGAGLPHLHLEIRKNDVIAVNPFTNGLLDSLDSVPPTFQAAYLYPFSGDSAVNGDLNTKEIRFGKGESSFVADSIPVVRGEFAVAVSVYDATSRSYHRTPHKITLLVDDQEVYVLQFDRFSYSEAQGFGLLYDLGKPGPSFYEYPILLTKMADFPLPFLKHSIPFSTRSLAPGEHNLKIIASDANQNSSTGEIRFVVNHPPRFDLDSVRRESGELILQAKITDVNWAGVGSLTGEAEYSIDSGETYHPITVTSLIPNAAKNALPLLYRIPIPALHSAESILVRGRAFDGYEYSHYTYRTIRWASAPVLETEATAPAGTLRYETYRSAIRVIFEPDQPVTGDLQATIGDPPAVLPLQFITPTSLAADIAAPKSGGDVVVALQGGQSLTVPVNFVRPTAAATVSGKNARLMISENGLYADAWIWSRSLPAYTSKSLPLIAPILELGPRGLPFRKPGILSFTYPRDFSNPEKLSIYIWNRTSQSWQSLPSNVNAATQTIEARISHLDLFALIFDNVAPKISAIFPKPRSVTRNQTPVLAVHVRDAGMDVDDQKVTLFVDGVPYPAEYDPDRNVASAKINRSLKPGTHKFYAVAYDYAGNQTQSPAITFRIR